MWSLSIIWLFFASMFFALGCFHWKISGKSIPRFKVSKRPMTQMPGVRVKIQMAGSDIDQPLEDFVRDFNNYVDNYNKSPSKQHKIQATGYWGASATAIFSFFLVM
jgi:hypothetical protein